MVAIVTENAAIDSEGSELDQKILQQESDQDFSGDEERAGQANQAFEAGSEDSGEQIEVKNPILFTEHQAIMGRVPMSKCHIILINLTLCYLS